MSEHQLSFQDATSPVEELLETDTLSQNAESLETIPQHRNSQM